jgi:hypothetical protein
MLCYSQLISPIGSNIIVARGLGQGFELIDQQDKKNYHVHPVNPVKNS